MTDTPFEDPDQNKLNIFENFRRSKRNSLTWSGILLLSALADSGNGTLSAPVITASYPTWLIIIGAFAVSVFMVIGYRRSEHEIIFRNSQFVVDQTADDLSQAFENLHSQAEEIQPKFYACGKEIEKIEKEINKLKDDLKSEIRHIDLNIPKDISFIEIKIKEVDEDIYRLTLEKDRDAKKLLPNLTGSFEYILNNLEIIRAKIEQQNSNLNRDYHKSYENISSMREHYDTSHDSFAKEVRRISDFAKSVTSLHRSVLTRDIYYFKWHDRIPTYGLFFFSCGTAIYHPIRWIWALFS